jgi:N-acetyl-anhydromuramyl-L-alanine amidase AmpD
VSGAHLIVDHGEIEAAGLDVTTWRDDPSLALKLGQDGRRRRSAEKVEHVVLHTTRGIPGGRDQRPQVIRPGLGPAGSAAEANARYWSRAGSSSGAHLVVDYDATIVQTSDLGLVATYHAGGPINGTSVGIEIVQGAEAELYEGQLAAAVRLCGWLAAYFQLPRTVQWPYRGAGAACAAFLGHRDVSSNRGRGDPGDRVYELLIAAGFAAVDRKAAR